MIRDASKADLDAIVVIYNASIPGRLATADTELLSMSGTACGSATAELSVFVDPRVLGE